MRGILTFILAGGRGERLDPLTRDRAKPAVPFGGIYRIIDYTLSNCINSGLRKIYVLTQYKSFSLQKHLLSGWDVVSSQLGEFIDVIPAQQRIGSDWYKGTADAIYQNMYAIQDQNPHLVLILAGDHIYRMNYKDMIDVQTKHKADAVVACVPMPKDMSTSFGVVQADDKGRVMGFQEKPVEPKTMPANSGQILASMGIYLFSREALVTELAVDAEDRDSDRDFGKNVVPNMLKRGKKVFVYNFMDENGRSKYWRDIGTRDAYYQANMDLVRPKTPMDIFDRSWPVRTHHPHFPPVKALSTSSGPCSIVDSLIGGGCLIEGARVEKAILSPNVKVLDQAEVKESIIMEGVVIGARAKIRRAIIDKEVVVPPGATIGYDQELDQKRFVLTTSGIVIVPKRTKIV